MLNIAFIVGKVGDPTYIQRKKIKVRAYKQSPQWLQKGIKPYTEFANGYGEHDNGIAGDIPTDVAIAAYINHYYSKTCKVTLFDGCQLVEEKGGLQLCNQMDVIFVIYGAAEILDDRGREAMRRFIAILKKTEATVIPSNSYYDYINSKIKYYKDLTHAGLPVAQSAGFRIKNITTLPQAQQFKDTILRKFGGKSVILKPGIGAYGVGLKIMKNVERTKQNSILKYFEKLQKKGYTHIIAQEFVRTFADNYEVRTYWVYDGKNKYKYAYSYASRINSSPSGISIDSFASEGGKMDDAILRNMKKLAQKALKATKHIDPPTPWLRIDIGCCLDNGKLEENGLFFVNEIETIGANLLVSKTKKDIIPLFSKAAYKIAKDYNKKRLHRTPMS